MSFSVSEDNTPAPVAVESSRTSSSWCGWRTGRVITTPLVWYPPLLNATVEQRRNFVLSPSGVHWPDVDEDLSVAGMLAGVIPTYRWVNHKARTA
jgi:hypothetical protein